MLISKCSPDELKKDLDIWISAFGRTRPGECFVLLSPKTVNFDLCQSSSK